jgi:hypothetical protein
LGYFEGGVDFGGVVVADNVVELGLVLRLLYVLAAGDGEIGGWDRDLKQWEHGWESGDGADVEVVPGTQVADVPPKVIVDTSAHRSDAADKSRGRIGGGQVVEEGRSRSRRLEAVEPSIRSEGILDSWRGFVVGHGELWCRRGVGDLLDAREERGERSSWEGSDEVEAGLA